MKLIRDLRRLFVPQPKPSRKELAIERLKKMPFFNPDAYCRINPDVPRKGAERHFISYGSAEGRQAALSTDISKTLGILKDKPLPKFSVERSDFNITVGLYSSSLGNIFMNDIKNDIGKCLAATGVNVLYLDENADIGARPEYCIYVAPHEFFFLGRGANWIRDEVLERACMYSTEQPQTIWFWRVLPLLLMAESIIDMAIPVAAAFSDAMPASHILPHPSGAGTPLTSSERSHSLLRAQHWWNNGGEKRDIPISDRPLDLCFFGSDSPARNRFFSRNAEILSSLECFLYLRKRNESRVVSIVEDKADISKIASFVSNHSKIVLNIHRDEFPYFEWHRIVRQGMGEGAVVLSEACLPDSTFLPNVHFLTEESRYLLETARWLLHEKDGQDKAQTVVRRTADIIQSKDRGRAVGVDIMNFITGSRNV